MTRAATGVVLLICVIGISCRSAKEVSPEPFDTRREVCSFCRMSGSDGTTAAQLIPPKGEPLFFDDIGCLRDYLARHAADADPAAVMFVVDHSSGEWIRAERAVFSRSKELRTPMDSHLMAHASEARRDADDLSRGATRLSLADVLASTATKGQR